MRSTPSTRATRQRFAAAALAGGLLFAACGGSDTATESSPAAVSDTEADPAANPDIQASGPVAVGAGFVDLVGPDVIPAAEIATNRLPSVVVDDLVNDRKVNFRNLVPQDRPILLWMWAPH